MFELPELPEVPELPVPELAEEPELPVPPEVPELDEGSSPLKGPVMEAPGLVYAVSEGYKGWTHSRRSEAAIGGAGR